MVLFVFQFYPVFNFGKFINFGLGTARGARVFDLNNLREPNVWFVIFSCVYSDVAVITDKAVLF